QPDHRRPGDTASYQLADGIAWAAVIGLFYWLYQFRLFEIPLTWWSLLSLFIAQDFLYYWFHRASHRIRWLWASHVVHHSSERSNLSTAFRQSMTIPSPACGRSGCRWP